MSKTTEAMEQALYVIDTYAIGECKVNCSHYECTLTISDADYARLRDKMQDHTQSLTCINGEPRWHMRGYLEDVKLVAFPLAEVKQP